MYKDFSCIGAHIIGRILYRCMHVSNYLLILLLYTRSVDFASLCKFIYNIHISLVVKYI